MRNNKHLILLLLTLCAALQIQAQSVQFAAFEKITAMDWTAVQTQLTASGFTKSGGVTTLYKGHYEKSSFEMISYEISTDTGKTVRYVCNNRQYIDTFTTQMLADSNWIKALTTDGKVQYCNAAKQACVNVEDRDPMFILTYTCCKP